MLERFRDSQPLESVEAVAQGADIGEASEAVKACRVSADVMDYMAALCEGARDPGKVRLGPSPRALLALMRPSGRRLSLQSGSSLC